jgi:hypothetical protein
LGDSRQSLGQHRHRNQTRCREPPEATVALSFEKLAILRSHDSGSESQPNKGLCAADCRLSLRERTPFREKVVSNCRRTSLPTRLPVQSSESATSQETRSTKTHNLGAKDNNVGANPITARLSRQTSRTQPVRASGNSSQRVV